MPDNANAPANQPGDLNQLEAELRDAVTFDKAAEAASARGDTTQAGEVPDKFKGKTQVEVATMYQELHSAYGRMANDLGVQRKLTDRLLDLKRSDDLTRNTPPPRVEIRADDVLENPTQAIEKVVDSRLAVEREQFSSRLNQLEVGLAQERFVAKHPDYQDVAGSQEFTSWIQGSAYRSRVASAAAQGDFQAADEILTEYKSAKKPAASPNQQALRDQARNASLEAPAAAKAGAKSGKVYRRADLIRLKIEKPHVYSDPTFQAEITAAYAQGRVR